MSNNSLEEPKILKDGKDFHKAIQDDWIHDAEGDVRTEVGIVNSRGRRRRIDVFVDAGEEVVAVIEVKSTDWTNIKAYRVRPNVRRHIRQVWDYMGTLMGPDNEGAPVAPALLYKHTPKDPAVKELIEELCDAESVQVVWQEEVRQ